MSLHEVMPQVPLLPNRQVGRWRRDTFTLDEEQARHASLRLLMSGAHGAGRGLVAGTYTRLSHMHSEEGESGHVMMSDTPAERRDHAQIAMCAEGTVLVTGLGIGMVAYALAKKTSVSRIIIVECEPDVIELTAGPLLQSEHGGKITIVQHDAYTWRGWERRSFDWAWHDIWPDMSADRCPEYGRMRRNYLGAMRIAGRQLCWGEETSRRDQREARRSYW